MFEKPTYEDLKERIKEFEKAEENRDHADAALRKSQEELRLFIDSTPDLCFLKDRAGKYLMVNSANARFFGKLKSEILGKTDFELMTQEAAQGCADTDTQAMEEGKEVIGLETLGERIYETRKIPVRRHGETIGVAGIIRDITEQKQMEQRLEKKQTFLSAVINTIEEAIVIGDARGRLVHFNEAALTLHGLPDRPIELNQWAQNYNLYRVDETTPLPLEENPLFRALKGEHVQNAEIVVAPKGKMSRYLVCNGQALTDGPGKITGAVVAMHDITESKQAENKLRESERRLSTRPHKYDDVLKL